LSTGYSVRASRGRPCQGALITSVLKLRRKTGTGAGPYEGRRLSPILANSLWLPFGSRGNNIHASALAVERHNAVCESKKRVVPAAADVQTGVILRAPLPHQK